MKTWENLDDNPLFERLDCPICGNESLRNYITIPYGDLKQKATLDYSNIGIGSGTKLSVDECPTCGFVFANPRIKRAHESLPYNESKRGQHEHVEGATGPKETKASLRNRRLGYLSPLLRLIELAGGGDRQPLSLLDVGAGYGHTLSLARALGIDGFGTDIDRARVTICREQGLEVYQPDEFDQAYPDVKFDMIMAQSIIEHAVDLPGFVASLALRANEGTVLFANGLTPEIIRAEQKRHHFVRAHFIEHINFTPIKTLDLVMSMNGYAPIKKYVVLLNNRRIVVSDLLARVFKRITGVSKAGDISRFYRYVGNRSSRPS